MERRRRTRRHCGVRLRGRPGGAGLTTGDDAAAAASQYETDFGVSKVEAERRLALQDRGAPLGAELRKALGPEFGGMWFDNRRGRFGIAVRASADAAAVRSDLAKRNLDADTDLVSARFSWADLQAAQKSIDAALRPLLDDQKAMTSLDATSNAVVIEIAADIDASAKDRVAKLAAAASVPVRLRERPPEDFKSSPGACALPELPEYVSPVLGEL